MSAVMSRLTHPPSTGSPALLHYHGNDALSLLKLNPAASCWRFLLHDQEQISRRAAVINLGRPCAHANRRRVALDPQHRGWAGRALTLTRRRAAPSRLRFRHEPPGSTAGAEPSRAASTGCPRASRLFLDHRQTSRRRNHDPLLAFAMDAAKARLRAAPIFGLTEPPAFADVPPLWLASSSAVVSLTGAALSRRLIRRAAEPPLRPTAIVAPPHQCGLTSPALPSRLPAPAPVLANSPSPSALLCLRQVAALTACLALSLLSPTPLLN
ncbi:hypothetical protein ACQJBY_060005 [Aegilops geniculata]